MKSTRKMAKTLLREGCKKLLAFISLSLLLSIPPLSTGCRSTKDSPSSNTNQQTNEKLSSNNASGDDTKGLGMPKLESGEVWISSIPVGLKLYVANHAIPKTPDESNYKGITPQKFKLDGGKYKFAIVVKKDSRAAFDPTLSQIKMTPLAGGELSIEYSFEKKTDDPLTMIVLATPKDISLDSLNKYYPQGNNFDFRDEEVRSIFRTIGVSDVDANKAIPLLHRNGKVIIAKERGVTILERSTQNYWRVRQFPRNSA
ncbi:MAG TPA: hypothetical protein VJ810_39965 [Blastocatellia bacterium]|nr:hypothetical protein [Blastocatellia bacterium]